MSGKCKCEPGFSGADCSVSVCKEGCNGNGVCDPKSTKCICNKGFIGETCNIPLGPKTQCPYDCFQNGACDDRSHICSCNPSHVAPYCKEKRCPADCSGHGTCNTVVGVCTCDKFFMAEADCSRKDYCPNNCGGSDHGECDTSTGVANANLAFVDLAVAKTFALLSPFPRSVAVDSMANAQWRVATVSPAMAARTAVRTFSFL